MRNRAKLEQSAADTMQYILRGLLKDRLDLDKEARELLAARAAITGVKECSDEVLRSMDSDDDEKCYQSMLTMTDCCRQYLQVAAVHRQVN